MTTRMRGFPQLWTRQPTASGVLDDKYRKRLLSAVVPSIGGKGLAGTGATGFGYKDLITGQLTLTTAGDTRATPSGLAARWDSGAYGGLAFANPIVLPSGSFTAVVVTPAVVPSAAGGGNPGLFRTGSNSDGGTFCIFQGSGSNRPWIRIDGADVLKPGSGTQVVPDSPHVVAFRWINGIEAAVAWNGAIQHRASTGSTLTSDRSIHIIGSQFDIGQTIGDIAGWFLLGDAASDEELIRLTMNPWRFFAPRSVSMKVPASAPPATLYGTLGQWHPELRIAAWF